MHSDPRWLRSFAAWLAGCPRGTRARLARALGVHRALVSIWLAPQPRRRPRPEQIIAMQAFRVAWTPATPPRIIRLSLGPETAAALASTAESCGLSPADYALSAVDHCLRHQLALPAFVQRAPA